MIEQFTILRAIRSGSSTPLLIETSEGQKYIVKLCAGLSGTTAILSEWLASRMGAAIGLPVQNPQLIRIDENTPVDHLYIEYRELIQKSFGLNLAYPFYEDAAVYDSGDPRFLPHPAFEALYIYDVFLLNIDRTAANPNLLCAGDQFISYDYESSFLLLGIVEGKDFTTAASVLQKLRDNPLFRPEVPEVAVRAVFSRLMALDIPEFVDSIPLQWLALLGRDIRTTREVLVSGLREAIRQEGKYLELLRRIEALIPVTEAERKRQIAANLKEFEKNWRRI